VVVATAHEAKAELARRKIATSFSSFFHAYRPRKPYAYGRHTTRLIDELQRTTEMVEAGECRFICICVPFRHGKSDIASRRYPVWHLCRNPDHEVVLASYNYKLATDMAYEARSTFRRVGGLFGLRVSHDRTSVDNWHIADHHGAMYSAGFGGTITGRGGHVLIIDDYLKNREEAESVIVRDRVWDSFQSDMMTRLAPVHAVVIVANRWHEDDLVGRIQRRNDKTSEDYDPDFPVFELLSFPAWDDKLGWLFPERFSDSWYRSRRSLVGSYAWSAMGLQDPQPRKGKMLRADLVEVRDKLPDEYDSGDDRYLPLKWSRGWDLASTEKQRTKTDPDFTVGTLATFHDGVIYVKDVVRGRWSAGQRNRRINEAALRDGRSVTVYVETVAGYKDTAQLVRAALEGSAVVREVHPNKDKVVRAASLEPTFEAGRVVLKRAPWNPEWVREFTSFPSSRHDDQVDSLLVAVKHLVDQTGRMMLSR
jgi:predicted phage terminase large subunit-like protein